jgi:O-antigen/teichoic acid export membrane protein
VSRRTAGFMTASLRTLLRGSTIYAAGTMLSRFGGFLLLPIYLQVLEPEEFGIVALVTSIVAFLTIVYRLGLDGALMRLHFDMEEADRPGLYRTLMAVTLALAGAASLLLAAGGGPFFESIFHAPFVPYGVLALAITFVNSADYVPSTQFRAKQQPGRFLAFNLGSFVITSAISVTLVLTGAGAMGVLLGQLIGGAIMFAVVLFVALRPRGPLWLPGVLRPALRFGVPIVPHQLSTWTTRLSDRWLLGILLALPTAQERLAMIGVYQLGYQLGGIVSMLATSFNAAWTPFLYRVGESPAGRAVFRHMFTITSLGFLWLALALGAFAPEVIAVIARPSYEMAADVLPVVAVGSAFQAMYTMLVGLIFLRRRTGYLPLITMVSAAVNVGLNLLLIPRFGIMGAAWTTLVAYVLFAVLTWQFARRVYPLSLDYGRVGVGVIVAVGGIVLARVVDGAADDVLGAGIRHMMIVGAAAIAFAGMLRGPLRELQAATAGVDENGEAIPSERSDTTPATRPAR